MGDRMILTEEEVQIALEFVLLPVLKKYDVSVEEFHLKIVQNKIVLASVLNYNQYHVDLSCQFQLQYMNRTLIVEHLEGKVEYLFLQFPIMSFLKSFIKDSHVQWGQDQIKYAIDLPISHFDIKEGYLEVNMKKNNQGSSIHP